MCLAVCLLPVPANAELLPSMDKKPWLGYFSGYQRNGFEFRVDNEGKCLIYLKDRRARKKVGHKKTIKIYTEVLVENAQGKLIARRLKNDGNFVTDQKAGLKHKEVRYTAESGGDAKVEVHIKYDRNRITMDGRVLDPGSLKGEKIYLGFKVMVPAMYGPSYNRAREKKLKAAMGKDRIRFVRAKDGKRVSLKSYEKVDLSDDELAAGGVTMLQVAMAGQKGSDFVFTTSDGSGAISFENRRRGAKAALWKGYYVKWKRPYVAGDDGEAKKDKVSPFVVEIR